MSPISLLGHSDQIYADAAALGIHIPDNNSLFEGDDLFDKTPLEDLHDQVYMLRGCSGEPVAHMPKFDNMCPRCAEQGIEQYVLPGKHCPRCTQPC